jgi:16S rRNA (cytidine1402-2'-O)-methyltransferase
VRRPLGGAAEWVREDPDRARGEFVLLLEGRASVPQGRSDPAVVLEALLAELPLKQAVTLAVKVTGAPRNALYAQALKMKKTPSR